MATKDISDMQVVVAYDLARRERSLSDNYIWPEDILNRRTDQKKKVCLRAMERAERRGLIEYGVSLRSGWLTESGIELLKEANE